MRSGSSFVGIWPRCWADLYRSKVEELAAALRREDTRLEASEMLRGLTAAQQTKRSPETGDLQVPMKMVAGGRNHLNLDFCWAAP